MMPKLVAFDLGKRTITSAIFSETALSFWEVRTLSNEFDRALASVSGFVRWTVESFPVQAIALESFPPEDQSRAARFAGAIIEIARTKGIPIHWVARDELYRSFAHPPVRSRAELREILSERIPKLAVM